MSVTISTKVPEELAERIDDAREEGENTSAAVRRLIRAGLEVESGGGGEVVGLPVALMWIGSLAVAVQYANAAGPLGPAGIVAMVAGYLLTYESVNDRARAIYAGFTNSEADANGGGDDGREGE